MAKARPKWSYTLMTMPGRGTPHAGIRVPEATWRRFDELAKAAGTDRSTLLRAFIAWYIRQAGAKLPDRP